VSVEIVVTRAAISAGGADVLLIAIADWQQIVADDAGLRLRVDPYVAVNPRTGETIKIRTGEADAEIDIDGQWHPFLRFRKGVLSIKYTNELDDPRSVIRAKISAIAKRLGAVVRTDAGDQLLDW
jgi:hypothetical protein